MKFAAVVALAAIVGSVSAHADVTISADPTQNMTCSGGVCVPTATDAVLNVTDLENFLASGNLTIDTTGLGIQANNIDITAPFSWSAASSLTLDAFQSITVTGAVTNEGTGGVSLITDDGGSGGTLAFLSGGSIGFSNLKDALMINGTKYKLAATLKRLILDVVEHPNHAFALAASYNAKRDGAYNNSPISALFTGSFSGLGNTISNLEIQNMSDDDVGLFSQVAASGSISGLHLQNVVIQGSDQEQYAGGLAGWNEGVITNSSTSGLINAGFAGGLVGYNTGTIYRSSSSATTRGSYEAGGLVATHDEGLIDESFATGKVTHNRQQTGRSDEGGLAGDVFAPITDSYAEGNVYDVATDGSVGGLVAFINVSGGGAISTSYSTGIPKPRPHGTRYSGGFIGWVLSATLSNCYWDTTTSETDVGVGGHTTLPGITGLTTSQLQSGLPSGFDSTIWAENPNINNGFPYLIANPPPQ